MKTVSYEQQKMMADRLMQLGWICTRPKRYNARTNVTEDIAELDTKPMDHSALLKDIEGLLDKQTLEILSHKAEPTHNDPNDLIARDKARIARIAPTMERDRQHSLDVFKGQKRHQVLKVINEHGPVTNPQIRQIMGSNQSSRVSELVRGELVSRTDDGHYSITTDGKNKLIILEES